MKRLFVLTLLLVCAILLMVSCTEPKHNPYEANKIEPTCITMGYSEFRCNHCDESYVDNFVSALGHVYAEKNPVIEEDCTTRGVYESKCMRCGDIHLYSVNAKGHSYVEISNDGSTVAYECEVCLDVVNIAGDDRIENYISATEIFDAEPNFTFDVVSNKGESYIRDNLKIIDSYFNGTEYEDYPDAQVSYTLTSKGNDVWTVSSTNDYLHDITYFAKLSGGVKFKEYRGSGLSFTIIEDPNHENKYSYKEGVVFLKTLESTNGGYYPYELRSANDGNGIYLVLNKIDGISKGQILCIGDVTSLDEITSDTECYFGVVGDSYPLSNGQWAVMLSEPELQTVFDNLDIVFDKDVELSDSDIDLVAFENGVLEALYSNDDFIEFLSAVMVASEKYVESNGYYSPNLISAEKFLNSVEVVPNVSVKGNTITTKLRGTIKLDIKGSSGERIGAFKIEFDFNVESQLKVDINYNIKTEWLGVKLDRFDVAMTQSDKINFDFRVSVDSDAIGTSGYVVNKTTGEAHLACCVEVTRANDSSAFEKVSFERVQSATQKCEHCKPENGASLENDFNSYYVNTLYCSDWERVANDISKLTQVDKNSTRVSVALGKTKIPICGPVSLNLELGFALSFDARALMDYSYSYTQKNVYGMRLNYGYIQPYSQMDNGTVTQSEIVVLGTLEARAGLYVDTRVVISGFEKWINAGVLSEVGTYLEASGVLDTGKDYSGAYMELGAYLDIDANYKLINNAGSKDLAEIKRALKKYGYDRLYFAFETYYDSINIECTYDIDANNLLAVRYYDLLNMVVRTDELSLSGGNNYNISVSFADGRYCEIKNGKIVYKQGAPEQFTDTLIIKVTSNDQWQNYKKNSAVYYLGEYSIDINFDTTKGHNYNEGTVVKASTCLALGEVKKVCQDCGCVNIEYIEKQEHDFEYRQENLTICKKCNAMKYEGRIYYIFTDLSTWNIAKSKCESMGGHLVTITSAEEEAVLEKYMNFTSKTQDAWLGGYKENGRWHWVTGEQFTYTNWFPGEPNDADGYEFYIETNHDGFGKWNDEDIEITNYYICEWEPTE